MYLYVQQEAERVKISDDNENATQLETLVKLAKAYAVSAGEMTKLKKDSAEIAKPLDEANRIGRQIDALIEKATVAAKTLASQRMVAATSQIRRRRMSASASDYS